MDAENPAKMDSSPRTIMLTRLLQSPIVDAILILLALRFLWPGLFGVKKKKPVQEHQHAVKNQPYSTESSKDNRSVGEYIDYEEIKSK